MSENAPNYEYFSEEELERLGTLAQAFYDKYVEQPTISHVGVEEDGSTTSVTSISMPEYTAGNRRVLVAGATPTSPYSLTIDLLDFMGEGSSRIAVGRQITLDASEIDRSDYGNSLQTLYIEMPIDENNRLLPVNKRTPETPEQLHFYRPFSQSDYDDMVEILTAAVES